jgi:hypothetical protein
MSWSGVFLGGGNGVGAGVEGSGIMSWSGV